MFLLWSLLFISSHYSGFDLFFVFLLLELHWILNLFSNVGSCYCTPSSSTVFALFDEFWYLVSIFVSFFGIGDQIMFLCLPLSYFLPLVSILNGFRIFLNFPFDSFIGPLFKRMLFNFCAFEQFWKLLLWIGLSPFWSKEVKVLILVFWTCWNLLCDLVCWEIFHVL